jgi:hypothetical protein
MGLKVAQRYLEKTKGQKQKLEQEVCHIPCDEAVAEEASSSSSSTTAEPSRVSLEGILSAKAASAVASADMDGGREGKWYPQTGT